MAVTGGHTAPYLTDGTPMKLSLLLFSAAAAVTPLLASAQSSSSDAGEAIRASVASLNARSTVESVRTTPVPGLLEVRADGQILYFTEDGQHMFVGDLYRVADRTNVTELARATARAALLQESDPATHIVYGPKDSTKVVYVFTDSSCGYCQKWHEQVPALNEAGVRVEYLAWPRGGERSPVLDQMRSVWCAKDRNTAYDGIVAGKAAAQATCDDPVLAHYRLGEELGIQGTPAIYTADGRQLGGYVNARVILKALSDTP